MFRHTNNDILAVGVKMRHPKTIYFSNENEEVINFNIKKKPINSKYKYVNNNILFNAVSFIVYRIFLTPLLWIYIKLFQNIKIINSKVLKTVPTGYYIYSNHTNMLCDAICPTFICSPKKPYIIVNSDNISLPLLGPIVKMCGAIPLPDDLSGYKNFSKAIKAFNSKQTPIFIYPEQHLWPYYTKIRKFSNSSFHYPIETNSPIFTSTTTYHKRKFLKKPRIVIYIDGPFYPDSTLNKQEQKEQLCRLAYNQMLIRANMN